MKFFMGLKNYGKMDCILIVNIRESLIDRTTIDESKEQMIS